MWTIGVFIPSAGAFYLKNSNSASGGDVTAIEFRTSMAGFRAVAGDWNRDGIDTIGVFVPASGAFYLKNAHTPGAGDVVPIEFRTNLAGWQAVVGDWQGPAGQASAASGAAETRSSRIAAVDAALARWMAAPAGEVQFWSTAEGQRLLAAWAEELARQATLATPGEARGAASSRGQRPLVDGQAVDVVLARLQRLAELGE